MPGASKSRVLDFMARNLGLGEETANNNWITRWYGMSGAWCMMTVSRALIEGGFSDDGNTISLEGVVTTTRKGWAYCPYGQSNMRNAGWEVDSPQVGAVVFFTWYESPSEPDHVGVVAQVDPDGTFWSYEGNQNDQLRLVHRDPSVVASYMLPPYTPEVPAPTPRKEDPEMFLFSTAAHVDGGSYWFVVAGVAHRMHRPSDVEALLARGVPDFGERSESFLGVFERRG